MIIVRLDMPSQWAKAKGRESVSTAELRLAVVNAYIEGLGTAARKDLQKKKSGAEGKTSIVKTKCAPDNKGRRDKSGRDS